MIDHVYILEYDTKHGTDISAYITEKALREGMNEIIEEWAADFEIPCCYTFEYMAQNWTEFSGETEYFRTDKIVVHKENPFPLADDVQEIIDRFETCGLVTALSRMVCDTMADEAENINESGLAEQLEHLRACGRSFPLLKRSLEEVWEIELKEEKDDA